MTDTKNETVDFEKALGIAIKDLPTAEARQGASRILSGRLEGPEKREVLIKNLASAGYTAEKAAQALAVVGLRHSLEMAWWKAGQASGLGTQGKERSGGSGARGRYNAAIGKAGALGSVATATAPSVKRTRKAKEEKQEPEVTGIIFTHKGGGIYVSPEGEEVKGKKNLPENAKVA